MNCSPNLTVSFGSVVYGDTAVNTGYYTLFYTRSKLALAPLIRSRRKYWLPRLDIPLRLHSKLGPLQRGKMRERWKCGECNRMETRLV
jgi:hypothetical protein